MSRTSTLRTASPTDIRNLITALVAKLRARGVSYHDAEDVAAEALGKGLDVENLSEPEAWLFTSALRGAISLKRREKTARKHAAAVGYHLHRVRDEGPDPVLDAIYRKEEAGAGSALLGDALPTLQPFDQDLVEAHVMDGATYRELGGRHQLSETAVKGRVRRAVARLRQHVQGRSRGEPVKAA